MTASFKRNEGNLTQLRNFIEQTIQLHEMGVKVLPGFVHGSFGIGKTETIENILKEHNYITKTYILSNLNYDEIKGLPRFKELDYLGKKIEVTKYTLADILFFDDYDPNKKYALFLDELTNANEFVLASSYSLLLERRIGEHYLPNNVIVLAGGNLSSDSSVSNDLPSTIKTRLRQFYYKGPNAKEFNIYMKEQDFCEELRNFIEHSKSSASKVNILAELDEDKKLEYIDKYDTLTTPRTVSHLSKVLKGLYGNSLIEYILKKEKSEKVPPKTSLDDIFINVGSLVDPEFTEDFYKYVNEFQKLPTIESILNSPKDAFENISDNYKTGKNGLFNYLAFSKYKEILTTDKRLDKDYLKIISSKKINMTSGVSVFERFVEFLKLFNSKEIRFLFENFLKDSYNKSKETKKGSFNEKDYYLEDGSFKESLPDLIKTIQINKGLNYIFDNDLFITYSRENLETLV